MQYLFDRTAAGGVPPGCQYLAVSLSGADREMEMSVDELREHYLPALSRSCSRARGKQRWSGFWSRVSTPRRCARAGRGPAAPRQRDIHTGTRARRLLDGHGLAGDAGGRGAQWPHGRASGAGGAMSELLVAAPLRYRGRADRPRLRVKCAVHKTGMGPTRSRAAAETTGTSAGEALLVLGFCGGLDAKSAPGEVIVAETVCTRRRRRVTPPRASLRRRRRLAATLRSTRDEGA